MSAPKTSVKKVNTRKGQSGSLTATRKMTTTAIMSAVATVLMYLEFPLPIIPSFIKLDFSEIPALLTSFALGPWYGALVCLIKNLLHMPASSSMYVGELSNFVLGCLFVVPAGYIYKRHKNRKGALVGSLVGTGVMTVMSLVTNYTFVYPFYEKIYHMTEEMIVGAYSAILPAIHTLPQALLVFNLPFTLVKGLLDVLVTFLVYKRISPLIKGTNSKKKTTF